MKWQITKEKYLEKDEIVKLLHTTELLAEQDKQQFKDYHVKSFMMCNLLFNTGMRIGEFQKLKHKDILLDEKCLLLNGKGMKKRFVPLSKNLLLHISAYCSYKKSIMLQPCNPDDYFFLSRLGKQYSVGGLEGLFHAALKKAGLRKRSPHSARHSFGFSYYQKHRDLRGLMALLGHSDLSVTQIYTQVEFPVVAQRVEGLYDQS